MSIFLLKAVTQGVVKIVSKYYFILLTSGRRTVEQQTQLKMVDTRSINASIPYCFRIHVVVIAGTTTNSSPLVESLCRNCFVSHDFVWTGHTNPGWKSPEKASEGPVVLLISGEGIHPCKSYSWNAYGGRI